MEVSEQDDAQSVDSDLSTTGYQVGLKEDLLAALSSIQTPGSFASFNGLTDSPPAGLFVHDVGNITFPLTESQAAQLIAKARRAPFGKGSETIVDTAVRNTWELDASQFTFQNPQWPSYVQHLCTRVAQDLGINTTVRAEIYKMLIYEKGAMFKTHTDTEKIPGMFGTLVVSLPSAHTGGEVVLKHCGEKKVFKTSEVTQSYACWYSDVSHEILPVTSGYRWVLTYNLTINSSEGRPSAALQRSEKRAIRHTLRRWLAESEESRKNRQIYHVLDHEYTEANVSLGTMKGRDLAQLQALTEICSALPCEIFFTFLEKVHMGECQDDVPAPRVPRYVIDFVIEKCYVAEKVIDMEGHIVAEALEAHKRNVLEENCFKGVRVDREEHQPYRGNSGPLATHWYRVTAVTIVPHDSLATFFASKDLSGYGSPQHNNFSSQISYLARASMRLNAKGSLLDAFAKLYTHPRLSLEEQATCVRHISEILKTSMQRENYSFFEEGTPHHQGLLPLDFFASVRQWLRNRDGNASERWEAIRGGISSAVSAYPSLANQYQAISELVPMSFEGPAFGAIDLPACVLDWAREKICSCLEACTSESLGKEDGEAILAASLYFPDPTEFLFQTVMPIIDQQHNAAAFHLAFLAELHRKFTPRNLHTEDYMQLYRTVATLFFTHTDFGHMNSEEGIEALASSSRFIRREPSPSELQRAVEFQSLVKFFTVIIKMKADGIDDLVTPVVSKIVSDAPRLPVVEFDAMWLPLLRLIIRMLISNLIPFDTPIYQELFKSLLTAYIETYVGKHPSHNESLVRPRLCCSCRDCQTFSTFLISSTRKRTRFAAFKVQLDHVRGQLIQAGIACTREIRQEGSSWILAVTKTPPKSYKAACDKWEIRRNEAAMQLKKFDEDHLRKLLAREYTKITDMEHIQALPSGQASGEALASTSTNNTGQPSRGGEPSALSQQPSASAKRTRV